jgi:hypothetical protein
MAGAVDVTARGAMEAGERDGGSRKPIQQGVRAWKGARVKCVVWDHAAFPKGMAVGEGGALRS